MSVSTFAPSGPCFHVVNLGCKVNRVESDEFAARLLAVGGREVPIEAADVVIVNTCTVTGEAEKKTRKAVRHALRANDFARVVVTGCAVAIDPAAYEAMDMRVSVVPKGRMAELLAGEGFAGEDASSAESGAPDEPSASAGGARGGSVARPSLVRVGGAFPTRAGVKVQDGCNNACTFCIVHVARGRATSRPSADIEAEVRALIDAGVREVVLTGINLGSYREGDLRLAGLLRRLLAACEGRRMRFRISSIEPRDVDDDLIGLMAAERGRICRHLHLPLQSGSTPVLRAMARPYTAERFCALVERLYDAMPQLSLSTDAIVGFPGETNDDFSRTVAVARACRFSKMHIFRYSKRAGTPAAARPDQVAPEEKARRAHELEAVADALREADRARRAGTRELVLVETGGLATTESYHTVDAPRGANVGDLVECML